MELDNLILGLYWIALVLVLDKMYGWSDTICKHLNWKRR